MVKTLPSNVGSAGLIPGEQRSHIWWCGPKKKKRCPKPEVHNVINGVQALSTLSSPPGPDAFGQCTSYSTLHGDPL